MPIETKDFRLPKKAYFKMLITNKLKYIIFAVFIVAGIMLFASRKNMSPEIIKNIALVLAVSLFSYLFILYFLRIKNNKMFGIEYKYSIHNDRLEIYYQGEIVGEYGLDTFIKVVKSRGSYFMYITKQKVIVLPDYAFKSDHDRLAFEKILAEKSLF